MAQIYSANLWSEIPPNGSTPHYIETTARLADNGLMVAQTKTTDHNWFGQFCGTAVVALVDASGNQIYPTDPQTFCVSGTLGGNCERTDTWTWRFGPDQVANARGLAIYHTGNADLFGGLWHLIESVWEFIQYLISSEQGQGTTGQPDSSVPDEQPWNAYSDFGAGGDAVAVRDPRGRVISLPSPFGTSSLGVPPIGGGGAQPAVGTRVGGARNSGATGEELRARG